MLFIALVLSCLFSLSFCQTRPTVTSNFGARVDVAIEDRGKHVRRVGMLYNDNTGRRERFDAVENKHKVDAWRIWSTASAGVEYVDHPTVKKCEHKPFSISATHIDIFAFIAQARLNGTCHADHKKVSGIRWTLFANGYASELCVSSDGKTPYILAKEHRVEKGMKMRILFHNYVSGRPSNDYFTIPKECSSEGDIVRTNNAESTQ